MDNKTFTGKFAGGKSIRNLFFLLYNGTFRRKLWKEEKTNKVSSNSKDETVAEQTFYPGISLWIVFNWPESGLAAFEEYISKEILAADLDLRSCKAIQGRGKISLLLFP